MGSALSKGAQGAVRRYPSRAIIPSASPTTSHPLPRTPVPAPRAPLPPKASSTKDQSIIDDARDPDMVPQSFSARLHELGIVTPTTAMTLSPEHMKQVHTSPSVDAGGADGTAGIPTARRGGGQLSASTVRKLLESQKAHDKKVDIGTVVRAVQLRAHGMLDDDIERRLGLQRGTVGKLGPSGVVEWAPPPGAA